MSDAGRLVYEARGEQPFRMRMNKAVMTFAVVEMLVFLALTVVFLPDLLHDIASDRPVWVRIVIHLVIGQLAGVVTAGVIFGGRKEWEISNQRLQLRGFRALDGSHTVLDVAITRQSPGHGNADYFLVAELADDERVGLRILSDVSRDEAEALCRDYATALGCNR